jgi:two-component system LytT family sensor kinase
LDTDADRVTFTTLHTTSRMTGALRAGLADPSVGGAAKYLHQLLNTAAVALTDGESVRGWEGRPTEHRDDCLAVTKSCLGAGKTIVVRHDDLGCSRSGCPIGDVVAAPLVVGDEVVGTLQAWSSGASAALIRATEELATWVSGQLDLAELDASRARMMEAEVRALRAQISPHFLYNALNAIASFVRTDPERARELLIEFAEFTRYSFQRLGEFTTVADELRSIQRYLVLEQARFGDRLQVSLRVTPEVLPVTVPVLSLQPLVENAVRHGIAPKPAGGTVTIVAEDHELEAVIMIEDDGVGEDPARVSAALSGEAAVDGIGLGNVDERLRATFGDDYGLVVETAPQAGTKVVVRVPKFAAGVGS